MIEISLVALIGMLIYVGYVVPQDGVQWQYFAAIGGVSVLVLLAFQVADIYQVEAFRGHEKQYFRLTSAWSVVDAPDGGTVAFDPAGTPNTVARFTKSGRYTLRLTVTSGPGGGAVALAGLDDGGLVFELVLGHGASPHGGWKSKFHEAT
jgi:hypothetical protein